MMLRVSVLQLGLVTALAAACSVEEPVDYPACPTPGQLVLEGELDGRPIAVTRDYSGFLFANALGGEDGVLDVQLDAAGDQRILINFPDLIAQGDETEARGIVELAEDDVVAGNCEADGLSGRITDDDGEVYSFVLRDLKASPFCGGAAIAGELRGCVRTNSF